MLFFKRKISKLSDEELLIHYTKSGDTEYFGELYNRYIPLLYGLCLKYLHDEDRAQEAVMQLFEDLLPKLSYADIVEQTGFTLNNVKSYIQNGKRNLKICIKKQAL